MIDVQHLTKRYGPIAAVADVSFHVDQGEIIGFLGPNAAGKSTTMRVLTGYIPATSGKATVAGFDVSTHPLEVKRRVGYLPENVPLYPEMLVESFLMYAATVKGVARKQRGDEISRVVARCGLEDMTRRPVGNLSKGYRQRVGLAQALIGSPPVLILDEPTVGLDPRQIIEIRQTIKDLARDHTVLLSTHILPEVAMICERVLIIHRGRVVAQDRVSALAEAEGEARVEVKTAGPRAAVLAALSGATDVGSVEAESEERYLVRGKAGEQLLDNVAKALVGNGLPVLELRRRSRTLEDVFVDAISSDDGGKAP